MLPALEARESIVAANRHAVGSGMLEKESRSEITGAWQKASGYGRARAAKATPEQLAMMGVQVVRVAAPEPK